MAGILLIMIMYTQVYLNTFYLIQFFFKLIKKSIDFVTFRWQSL